jgi:hypothetical protein
MRGNTERGAVVLTAFGVFGALVVSIGTVAAMATRSMSGAGGARILELASITLGVVFAGARVLRRRALRTRMQAESEAPAI